MTRAAIYLRVSTERQSSENQRPELEALARARGFEIVAVFDDTGSAAKALPEREKLLAAAQARRFDVLIVWALDRFGRSLRDNVSALLELERIGVQVVSLREPWMDTGGPVRSLLVAIFSWVAEQERERLRERTRAGLARALREGRKGGRPRADPAALAAAEMAYRRTGSLQKAAKSYNIGKSTLFRYLHRSKNGGGGKPGGTHASALG